MLHKITITLQNQRIRLEVSSQTNGIEHDETFTLSNYKAIMLHSVFVNMEWLINEELAVNIQPSIIEVSQLTFYIEGELFK